MNKPQFEQRLATLEKLGEQSLLEARTRPESHWGDGEQQIYYIEGEALKTLVGACRQLMQGKATPDSEILKPFEMLALEVTDHEARGLLAQARTFCKAETGTEPGVLYPKQEDDDDWDNHHACDDESYEIICKGCDCVVGDIDFNGFCDEEACQAESKRMDFLTECAKQQPVQPKLSSLYQAIYQLCQLLNKAVDPALIEQVKAAHKAVEKLDKGAHKALTLDVNAWCDAAHEVGLKHYRVHQAEISVRQPAAIARPEATWMLPLSHYFTYDFKCEPEAGLEAMYAILNNQESQFRSVFYDDEQRPFHSLSVGDVIEDPATGVCMLVMPFGFKRVPYVNHSRQDFLTILP